LRRNDTPYRGIPAYIGITSHTGAYKAKIRPKYRPGSRGRGHTSSRRAEIPEFPLAQVNIRYIIGR